MTGPFRDELSKLVSPVDDGAVRHLPGLEVPSVPLPATDGSMVDLAMLGGRIVVFAYPRIDRPKACLGGTWDTIPGARGSRLQLREYRDHVSVLKQRGTDHLFGLSSQPVVQQCETAEQLDLGFLLLSDLDFRLTNVLNLPTFETGGLRFLKRVTLVVSGGIIEHVFYPVFPPYRNASDVAAWLQAVGAGS